MTTINKTNYFKKVKNIDFKALPDGLKEGFETIKFGSKDYSSWEYLEDYQEFLRVYFEKMNSFLKAEAEEKAKVKTKNKSSEKKEKQEEEKIFEGLTSTLKRKANRVCLLANYFSSNHFSITFLTTGAAT